MSLMIPIVFETDYQVTEKHLNVALLGSIKELGKWKESSSVLATQVPANSGHWVAIIQLQKRCHFEWKWVIFDMFDTQVVEWEERDTRKHTAGISREWIRAPWNKHAKCSIGFDINADAEDKLTQVRGSGRKTRKKNRKGNSASLKAKCRLPEIPRGRNDLVVKHHSKKRLSKIKAL